MRKALLILIGLLVLLIAAILSIPRFIDWNGYRARISQAFTDATGLEMHIDGDLRISIFPSIEVRASKVRIANAPGSSHPEMFSVKSIDGKVSLFPLFSQKLVIEALVVREPKVYVEIDDKGHSNWDLGTTSRRETTEPPPLSEQPAEQEAKAPISDLRFTDVRINKGEVLYSNSATGQTLSAMEIDLAASLPDLASPFNITGRLILNDEPVSLRATVSSFRDMASGEPYQVDTVLDSAPIKMICSWNARQKPTPVLDGSFRLEVPSLRGFYTWLKEPVQTSGLDPGPLKVHAAFASQDKKVTLKEAAIESEGIQARATGSYDGSGETARLTLSAEGGVLYFNRYLPERPAARAKGLQPARETKSKTPLLESVPDEPFDLAGLRKIEATIRVAFQGIEARGLKTGPIELKADVKNGLLSGELSVQRLYGGDVKGELAFDGAKELPVARSSLHIHHVKVDELARSAGEGSPTATGIASGDMALTAQGRSPRELAASIAGHGTFALEDAGPSAGEVSGLNLALDFPGMEKSPTLKASVVYGKEPIDVEVVLDPLQKVMAGDRFAIRAHLTSAPVTAAYEGEIQRKPMSGLDGTFQLQTASMARLAAWAGHPLDASREDPGPLKLHAILETEGKKVTLKEATIEGKAVQASARGSVDGSGPVPTVGFAAEITRADLDVYTAYSRRERGGTSAKPGSAQPESWSDTPLDIGPLARAKGKAQIHIASVRYRGLVIPKGEISLTLSDGTLKASIDDLSLSQGVMNAKADISASEATAKLDYELSVKDAAVGPLLEALTDDERIIGIAGARAEGNARGHSLKELVASLNGSGSFKVVNGAIRGINLAATLRNAQTLSFGGSAPGFQQTDFAELSGSFTITNGTVHNQDLSMLAPVVRLNGSGRVPLPARTVDYAITAKLVPTLEGQGGENALAGLPIPIAVTGPWTDLRYHIDWENVFQEAARDPERLKNMPDNLRRAAKGFGIDPGSAGIAGEGRVGETLGSIPDVSGGASPPGGGSGGMMDRLKQTLRPQSQTDASADTPPQGQTKPESRRTPTKKSPLKSLKGLFGQ